MYMSHVLRTKNEERGTGDRPSSFSGLVSGIRCLSSGVRLQSAFTLIELLITIVLVGIVLLALIMSFHESLKSMEKQKDLLSANLLGEDLMNEIRSKQYVHTNAAGTNNRVNFNDVDDYDDFFETPPKTIEGDILSNYSGFTRRVFVANVSNVSDWAAPTTNPTDFKRITVVVSNALMSVSNVSVVSRYDYD